MKGLLLKDLYVTLKKFGIYFIIDAVFIAISFFVGDGITYLVFPLMIAGIVPISLLYNDERSKWVDYSGALPYSSVQIVSSKYIFGLLFELFTALVTFAFLLLHTNVIGTVLLEDALVTFGGIFIASLVVPSMSLPLCFVYGTEKGRIVNFVFIFVLTWLLVEFEEELRTIQLEHIVWIIVTAAAVLYVLSWIASVSLYKKRAVKG